MPPTLQNEARNSHPRRNSSTAVKRSPTYLYLRGSLYYFRYALSAEDKARYGHSEVRISLRTGFLHEARKRAKRLHTALEEALADISLPNWEGLKARLTAELEAQIDACPNKKPLNIVEIRERMDAFLNDMLNKADSELHYPADSPIFRDGHLVFNQDSCFLRMYDNANRDITNNEKALKDNYSPFAIYELLSAGIISIEELTQESILPILNEYHKKAKIAYNKILLARHNGDFAYERPFYNTPQLPIHTQSPEPVVEQKPAMLLSELIAKFIDAKVKDGAWDKADVPTYKSRITPIIDILGDIPISNIKRDKIRHCREIIKKLPPNRTRSKKYKDKSIEEILKMDISKTLSVKTINGILNIISEMFEWGKQEGLVDNNPAQSLGIKDNRQEDELRDGFTEEEIKKIFFSGNYIPENFKNPAYYWVPLISLYTGMRLEEICQLHNEDIYEEDSIWLFDIRESSTDSLHDKSVKTKNAVRRIPIHQDLIELGLLDYHSNISQRSKRLFPELNKTESTTKYGKQVGKQFKSLLNRLDIYGKKSFHSLRHTFDDYFKKRHMLNNVFIQIFGHSQDKLAARQYGSKFSPRQCYDEIISKIQWKK